MANPTRRTRPPTKIVEDQTPVIEDGPLVAAVNPLAMKRQPIPRPDAPPKKAVTVQQRAIIIGGKVRDLTNNEGDSLIFIAQQTQEDPSRGATISAIDAHMGPIPCHDIIDQLRKLNLVCTPTTDEGVPMTMNLRTTDTGHMRAAYIAEGRVKTIEDRTEPKTVSLPGDDSPSKPQIETDNRMASEGDASKGNARAGGAGASVPGVLVRG